MSTSSGKQFTVSEVIDSFGINSHTWLMFILLGLANIFDGYDFMVVNSTNSYLAASFGVVGNTAAIGSLTTWGLLGMVLGGAVGGIMSDKIGRKKMLIIACLFYGLFTLPQAFSTNVPFCKYISYSQLLTELFTLLLFISKVITYNFEDCSKL